MPFVGPIVAAVNQATRPLRRLSGVPSSMQTGGAAMYVTVIHTIHDPQKFWGTVEQVVSTGGIPDHLSVEVTFPDVSGGRAVCLWQADSVDAVRDFIEPAVGAVSDNEYFEVAAGNAVGLPK